MTGTYSIYVDYDRSVKDGAAAGRYDQLEHHVVYGDFAPPDKSGKVEIIMDIIQFSLDISLRDACGEIEKRGFYRANIHDLLALGEKYPDVQRKFPVIAVDSVFRDRYGGHVIPCLCSRGGKRCLDIIHLRKPIIFSRIYRFLVIHK